MARTPPDARRCPRCRLLNPLTAKRCDCGRDLRPEHQTLFRNGRCVVVGAGGTLPARCVKCNGPAAGEPIRYAFVSSGVNAPHGVITGILHFATRRTGQVHISLCAHHRRVRRLIYRCAIQLAVLGVGLGTFVAIANPRSAGLLAGIAAFLVLAALFPAAIYQSRSLKGYVDRGLIWVSGAGDDFLDSLPER